MIRSTPLVGGERLYVSAAHATALEQFGTIYCLDRAAAETLGVQPWRPDRTGAFLPGPGREPPVCWRRPSRGYRLQPLLPGRWHGGGSVELPHAQSHGIEPCLADGYVFFGAGDDGVYCLKAADGVPEWQFPGCARRCDAGPARRTPLCRERLRESGNVLPGQRERPAGVANPERAFRFWLPRRGGRAGLFRGGEWQTDPQRAATRGMLVCLDAATGKKLWRYDVADAVVYAGGCRGLRLLCAGVMADAIVWTGATADCTGTGTLAARRWPPHCWPVHAFTLSAAPATFTVSMCAQGLFIGTSTWPVLPERRRNSCRSRVSPWRTPGAGRGCTLARDSIIRSTWQQSFIAVKAPAESSDSP